MLYLQPFFINIIVSFSFINIFANCLSKDTNNVKLNCKREFMKRKLMLLLACLFVGIGLVTAQTQKITGVVISEEDGQPVVGASVLVKGTTQGTITDVDGNFNLSNVPSSAKTLQISYIGMQTQEVVIKPNLKVVLKSDSQKLDEVVVTAMGIKRSEKSLGYSVTSVKGDEITKARESNVLNSLSGKIAGVQIGQSSGTAGGSSSIQIRGASSIGSVSSPLFIVDGLPIDNGAFNPDRTNGIVDVGNRAGDISSDDIESINVLKGAAATALYGARAKDGAIVITTKKGSRNSQVSVTVNSSTRFENVLKLPDFQNDYAQGSYGKYNVKMLNGWGPKISSVQDQTFADFKGEQVTLQAYPDNVKDFYETGMSYINNVAIAGGTERSDFRISVSTTNQTGVVPGSDYNKYAFAVNGGMNFTKNFTGRVSAQYIRSDSEGRPAQGSNDNNLLIPLINGMPRTVNINDVKNNWIDEYGKQISLDPEGKSNNPYWIINKNKFTNQLDRLIGNIVLTYKPIEGLTISNNAGTDFYTETRRKVYSKGTIGNLEGQFQTWDLYKRILNNDLMISYEKTFAEDYGVKVMLGHNIYQEDWRNNNVLAQNLVVDELYAYTNAKTTSPVNYTSKKRLVGLYGDISFSYKNMVFLDVTGRNDWSSTLPVNNRSYFYPSISGSFIFTELMKNKDVLSYGKLRMSYANVGSDEQPYQLAFQYTPVNSYFLQYNLTNVFPHNGLVGFTGPRVLPNENLKPQNQASFEVGTDLRFFQNRIRLDLTYYKSVTKNQIVSIDVPLSTGYFANNINAGKVSNKGIEVALGVTPVQTKDFKWDLEATFAKNTQKVDELAEGLDEYSLTSGLSGLQIKAEVGGSFGLYGTGWKRDDSGNYVINEKTGLREIVNNVRLGDVYPDFTMGINNTFSYKGFTLSFLIDIRQGGSLYSETVGTLRTTGLAAETAAHREDASFIEPGVILQSDGTYRANDVPVKSMQDYWGHVAKSSNNEGNIFDASYVKLRELNFSYSFPRKWFRSFFVKSLDLGFEARNLWIIKDHVPHIDPEANFFGPAQIGGGVEFNSIPTTRSFGFNIRLTL